MSGSRSVLSTVEDVRPADGELISECLETLEEEFDSPPIDGQQPLDNGNMEDSDQPVEDSLPMRAADLLTYTFVDATPQGAALEGVISRVLRARVALHPASSQTQNTKHVL